jgi:N-methylhydantoinase A
MPYQIGCDIGGTFTDITVMNDEGKVWTDKADTTPGNLANGVEQTVENVADRIGVPVAELLEETNRFVNGTTVVTNGVIELNGAKTGLLTTKGFNDTLRIARSPRTDDRDHHDQQNVPDIVPRDCIREIPERIDYSGAEIVALDEDAVKAVVTDLVENEGVETLAICFLWSFQNPDHENRAKEIIEEQYPDLYVTISHEIYPKIREYERMVTTTLNSYTAPDVATYVNEVQERLQAKGLDKSALTLMQGSGGSTTLQEAKSEPIRLVDSGPVGGVIGAQALGEHLENNNIICADMGGTSFETSIIENGEHTVSERTNIREFETGLTKIQTNTIGAGGGSIAWLDNRGIPQVGPQSTGADPGPACYGEGGTKPTVTDAVLVLGLMSPEAFLGGRRELDKAAAEQAIEETIADPLGYSVEEAAAAIYEIAVNSMSNAVRNVTVEQGRNPGEFTFVSYGGASPLYAADICETLGIERAVIPQNAPVFSAYGLLQADDVRNYSQSVFWEPGDDVGKINEALEGTVQRAKNALHDSGFDDDEITIERQGEFKFKGQLFSHPVSLPDGKITIEDIEQIQEAFPEIYEEEYGSGTAWVEVPIILRGVRVRGVGRNEKPSRRSQAVEDVTVEPSDSREVYLPQEHEYLDIDIYAGAALQPGVTVKGPAVIEADITTVFIPEGHEVSVDEYTNYDLSQIDMTEQTTAQTAEPTTKEGTYQ